MPDPGVAAGPSFAVAPDPTPPGLVRRALVTGRHLSALLAGAFVASVDAARADPARRGSGFWLRRVCALLLRPVIARRLRHEPFPVQFRRRLELLGPTYIKLGQILSLREDILPREITTELKRLLDRLPAVPCERLARIVERDLGAPPAQLFARVDPEPLGSASIAQTHRATTLDGHEVILKVVKPGIRGTLERDAVLLRVVGSLLQLLLPRYQPRRVIAEFCDYTLREVDLQREADNAETFAANFSDLPDVVFPPIYRQYSSRNVLCMAFLDGTKPSDPAAQALTEDERDRLIDLGAASIIRMLYRDGFFHADLHPATFWCCRARSAGSSISAWWAASTRSCGARCSTTTTASSSATPRTPPASWLPWPSPHRAPTWSASAARWRTPRAAGHAAPPSTRSRWPA